MIPAFRTTALAAALSLFALAETATASPSVLPSTPVDIDINFTDLGNQAACVNQPAPCTAAPKDIDGTKVQGVVFKGASVWQRSFWNDFTDPPIPTFDPNTADTVGGFVINSKRNTSGSSDTTQLQLTLGDELAGRYFSHIAISLFTNAASSEIQFYGATVSPADFKGSASLTQGTGGVSWSDFDTDVAAGTRTIVFSLTPGASWIGMDNLRVWLTDATTPGGGNVPEPAGYALVGLALLAAGAASRRARR